MGQNVRVTVFQLATVFGIVILYLVFMKTLSPSLSTFFSLLWKRYHLRYQVFFRSCKNAITFAITFFFVPVKTLSTSLSLFFSFLWKRYHLRYQVFFRSCKNAITFAITFFFAILRIEVATENSVNEKKTVTRTFCPTVFWRDTNFSGRIKSEKFSSGRIKNMHC